MLKSYLKASQDDVASLLDEKRTLMDTIKSLQVSPPPPLNLSFFTFPTPWQSQLISLEPRDGKR